MMNCAGFFYRSFPALLALTVREAASVQVPNNSARASIGFVTEGPPPRSGRRSAGGRGGPHHLKALEMTKQRLEKLIETTAPNGFRVRVFRDSEADKLVTFGGDVPKVSALESDKPKSVMQAMSDMFVAFKNLNDCAKEMGMTGQDRANLTLDLLSLLKKGPAK
jgi:hypothetical protein